MIETIILYFLFVTLVQFHNSIGKFVRCYFDVCIIDPLITMVIKGT